MLKGEASGAKYAVDPEPLTPQAHVAAVLAGRYIYTRTPSGNLRLIHKARPAVVDGVLLGDHACPGAHLNAVVVEPTQEGPQTPCRALEGCPRPEETFMVLEGAETAVQPISCLACDPPSF